MHLPPDFTFSQANLQDYVDCPRRFQYRCIEHRSWPAAVSEPVLAYELAMLQGAAFHRLIQQHLSGVPLVQVGGGLKEEALRAWWTNYQAFAPAGEAENAFVEFSLSAPLETYRLSAKYDLILHQPDGALVIYDWKTSKKRTRREHLAGALQTRVYRYLLVRAGSRFTNGQAIDPACVRMVYWFAGFPEDPETFPYSQPQYEADGAYLKVLVEEIQGRCADGDFPSGTREGACLYCVYRSLCGRGVCAGDFSGSEDEPADIAGSPFELDFDQLPEIAY